MKQIEQYGTDFETVILRAEGSFDILDYPDGPSHKSLPGLEFHENYKEKSMIDVKALRVQCIEWLRTAIMKLMKKELQSHEKDGLNDALAALDKATCAMDIGVSAHMAVQATQRFRDLSR